MNRAACDNALLATCGPVPARVVQWAKAIGTGLMVAVFWYALVCLRAGA